jgi:hypothetical protein
MIEGNAVLYRPMDTFDKITRKALRLNNMITAHAITS